MKIILILQVHYRKLWNIPSICMYYCELSTPHGVTGKSVHISPILGCTAQPTATQHTITRSSIVVIINNYYGKQDHMVSTNWEGRSLH